MSSHHTDSAANAVKVNLHLDTIEALKRPSAGYEDVRKLLSSVIFMILRAEGGSLARILQPAFL